jgi:hypothetical protein
MYQPLRKAQLAHDRASRARRRSGKDSSVLSPTSSETAEQTEGMKEEEDVDEETKEQEKQEEDERPKAVSESNTRPSRKRKRHDSSEKLQESKCSKTEE